MPKNRSRTVAVAVPHGYSLTKVKTIVELDDRQDPIPASEPLGHRACATCHEFAIPIYQDARRGSARHNCEWCADDLRRKYLRRYRVICRQAAEGFAISQ